MSGQPSRYIQDPYRNSRRPNNPPNPGRPAQGPSRDPRYDVSYTSSSATARPAQNPSGDPRYSAYPPQAPAPAPNDYRNRPSNFTPFSDPYLKIHEIEAEIKTNREAYDDCKQNMAELKSRIRDNVGRQERYNDGTQRGVEKWTRCEQDNQGLYIEVQEASDWLDDYDAELRSLRSKLDAAYSQVGMDRSRR